MREIFLTKVEFIVFKLVLLKPMSGEVNLENAPLKRVVYRCCNTFVPAAHHPYDLFHFRYKNFDFSIQVIIRFAFYKSINIAL